MPHHSDRSRTRHRISYEQFEALASGLGDHRDIAVLRASERSWRMVLLRTLLDVCATRPDSSGPLAPVDDAWRLLVRAQRRRPDSAERVLMHPQTGIWAAYTMRRLRHGPEQDPPLWVDLGYLHCLAAAAAIRADLDFEIDIPVRHGMAVLPTIGNARLPAGSSWQHARVRSAGGRTEVVEVGGPHRVAVRPAGSPDWQELRHLRADVDGLAINVELDDLNPYRDLRSPTAPRRLADGQAARWGEEMDQAWRLLAGAHRPMARAIAAGLQSLVPLPPAEPFRPLSASGEEAFGSVLLSEADNAPQLAATLVHEFQHNKLGALLHLVTLYRDDDEQRYYAPWRDDPRPLGGLLQGTYAFTGITEFWRTQRQVAPAGADALGHFEFALWRRQTLAVLRTLAGCAQLTPLGGDFVASLTRRAESWQDEPVPGPALAAARLAAADHRAIWRAHHLRVDAGVAAALARAWTATGTPDPRPLPEPVVAPDPAAGAFDGRATLIRHRCSGTAEFDRLTAEPARVGEVVSGALPADVALVAGDLAAARAQYQELLRGDPVHVRAWVGLGLTAGPDHPEARALLHHPELVLAVVRALGGSCPAPLRLAAWIGTQLGRQPDVAVR